jgi:hypothetical protein
LVDEIVTYVGGEVNRFFGKLPYLAIAIIGRLLSIINSLANSNPFKISQAIYELIIFIIRLVAIVAVVIFLFLLSDLAASGQSA